MEDFERLNNRKSNILKDKKIAIITYHKPNNYVPFCRRMR